MRFNNFNNILLNKISESPMTEAEIIQIINDFCKGILAKLCSNTIITDLIEGILDITDTIYLRLVIINNHINNNIIYEKINDRSKLVNIYSKIISRLIKIVSSEDRHPTDDLGFVNFNDIEEDNEYIVLGHRIPFNPSLKLTGYIYLIKHYINKENKNNIYLFLKYMTLFLKPILYHLIENLENTKNAQELEKRLRSEYDFSEIVGHHPKLIEVLEIVSQVAATTATILIQGECGTGKELIARAIHNNSQRRSRHFLAINCGAIPENLLESELFGHVRGAFTGAIRDKKGWFETANGGVIFLDEVSKMSPALQIKLLRILQTGEYSCVGSTDIEYSDVRIIAATDKDLTKLIKLGQFREDVYYRLNVILIKLPALHERKSDILTLTDHFIEKFSKKYNKDNVKLSSEAETLLLCYDYPGNVRELENAIERAILFSEHNQIKPYHLPTDIQLGKSGYIITKNISNFKYAKKQVVKDFEKNFIIECLQASHGNISLGAKTAGINIKNFYMKMKDCCINPQLYKIH